MVGEETEAEGGLPIAQAATPPLRVLALTGPNGSGCTTVSSFFDVPGQSRNRPNELLQILMDSGIVLTSFPLQVNWEMLNSEIATTGDLHDHLDDTPELSGPVSDAFKGALTQRELAHAFRVLFKYYPQSGHLFRTISVSDLIVFHTMRALEEREFREEAVPDQYRNFVRAISAHRTQISEGFRKALERVEIFGLSHYYAKLHGENDEHDQEKLVRAFGLIHVVSQRVKSHLNLLHPREYVALLQDFGNNIRRCGDPFDASSPVQPERSYTLARDVARVIRLLHSRKAASFFVIDSLRNPFEIIFLRHEFADFFVVSLYADKEIRTERTQDEMRRRSDGALAIDEAIAIFEEADRRDSGGDISTPEENLYKQNVPKCVQLSDIAVNNGLCVCSEDCRETLAHSLLRPLCLILEPGCTKPTEDEMFMNGAYTLAVKSNCISRQVGAIVVGPQGYIVGAGWNDVGKGLVSCGVRAIADLGSQWCMDIVDAITRGTPEELIADLAASYGQGLPHDQAKQCWLCFKDVMAKKTVRPKIMDALRRKVETLAGEAETKAKAQRVLEQLFEQVLSDVNIHQLEYCLALHAEENAILQSAKIGGMGMRGGKIYTTAQPCTLCSKKIQQVGLSEVIYTEPYPKSHPDVYMPGVTVRQFEGVKPRAYIRLFMPHHDRKEWQELSVRGLIPNI